MTLGIQRMVEDLVSLGYSNAISTKDSGGNDFAVIPEFEIPGGSFATRVIDLALPVPPNYPGSMGASIHIKANPHLVEFGHIPDKRNVIASALGSEWQYWSYNFSGVPQENATQELLTKIYGIFRDN